MKFFEQNDFDIALFTSVFRGVYNVYYDSGMENEEYDESVRKGVALVQAPENAPLLKAYWEYAHNIITSDREMATLAVTYGIFEDRYNKEDEV